MQSFSVITPSDTDPFVEIDLNEEGYRPLEENPAPRFHRPANMPCFFSPPGRKTFITCSILLAGLACVFYFYRCDVREEEKPCILPPIGFTFSLLLSLASFAFFVEGCCDVERPSQQNALDISSPKGAVA